MNEQSPQAPVVIIGGGPSGLMVAETLAKTGIQVAVYDRMGTVGRKFMMAGIGGLNLTHGEPLPAFVARYGVAAQWIEPVLQAFPPTALRYWSEGLGHPTFVGSSGRVFPKELKASPLLRAWLKRLNHLGVVFHMRQRWLGWSADGQLLFSDADGVEHKVAASAVLLALGGASWPRLGSDGAWTEILAVRGVDIAPLRPANCGFIAPWSDQFAERFAGQPLKPVVASFGGVTRQGELMITRGGVEGGLVYAFSSALREVIDASGSVTFTLDLRPGLSATDLAQRLASPRGSQSASTFLRKAAGLSPQAVGLLREATQGAALPESPATLAALIKATPLRLTQTAPIARAISSAGGVKRDELDEHFMLRKAPGVFVAGEMIDWEAPTGGYLLQACFSIAVAASRGIDAWIKSKGP